MKKTIELAQVRQGEVFEVAGERFVRLSEEQCGAILVLREDVLPENCAFERDNTPRSELNYYNGSDLMAAMLRWLPAELTEQTVPRPIDLTTMGGMTDYGMPNVRVRALTVMEYQRYRRYIPLASRRWWTATPGATLGTRSWDLNSVWYVRADGTMGFCAATTPFFAARPALYLKSSIPVSVESEDGGKKLTDYTDRELLDELARRDDARHTAPEWVMCK